MPLASIELVASSEREIVATSLETVQREPYKQTQADHLTRWLLRVRFLYRVVSLVHFVSPGLLTFWSLLTAHPDSLYRSWDQRCLIQCTVFSAGSCCLLCDLLAHVAFCVTFCVLGHHLLTTDVLLRDNYPSTISLLILWRTFLYIVKSGQQQQSHDPTKLSMRYSILPNPGFSSYANMSNVLVQGTYEQHPIIGKGIMDCQDGVAVFTIWNDHNTLPTVLCTTTVHF